MNDSLVHESAAGIPLQVFGVDVTILSEDASRETGHTVTRLAFAPGAGAPLHRHPERESFYVLVGEVTLTVDGAEQTLGPGGFAQVEPGRTHRFENTGAAPATLINLSQPAGHADFFRAADALWRSGGFTPERAREVCEAHRIELVPPTPPGQPAR